MDIFFDRQEAIMFLNTGHLDSPCHEILGIIGNKLTNFYLDENSWTYIKLIKSSFRWPSGYRGRRATMNAPVRLVHIQFRLDASDLCERHTIAKNKNKQ
jgi:hypothetical protein